MNFQQGYKYVATHGDSKITLLPTSRIHKGKSTPAWFVTVEKGGMPFHDRGRSTPGRIEVKLKEYDIDPQSVEWVEAGYIGTLYGRDAQYSNTGELIYFINAIGSGRIKIGYTNELSKRLEYYTTASPFPVEIIGYIPGNRKDDTRIKVKFSHIRLHNEWFQDCPELRQFIKQHAVTPICLWSAAKVVMAYR